MVLYLFFDTETTGLPKDRRLPATSKADNWPDIVSISWVVYEDTRFVRSNSYIIKPNGWTIPAESTGIHGIDNAFAEKNGHNLDTILLIFLADAVKSDVVVAHNLSFDKNVVDGAWKWRLHRTVPFEWPKLKICTAELGKDLCKFKFARGGEGYRYPKLSELYIFLCKRNPHNPLHNSLNDTLLLVSLFFAIPSLNPGPLKSSALFLDIQNGLYPYPDQGTLLLDLSEGGV